LSEKTESCYLPYELSPFPRTIQHSSDPISNLGLQLGLLFMNQKTNLHASPALNDLLNSGSQ